MVLIVSSICILMNLFVLNFEEYVISEYSGPFSAYRGF
jgi:hypothetical protein